MNDSFHGGRSAVPRGLMVALWLCIFPLIWVGGLVTTTKAGMAVPDWPGTYGWNLLLYPWATWWSGPWNLFIEHGHRLLGSLAGLLAVALVAATWATRQRAWVRVAAGQMLAVIVAQGGLGGARVLLDERRLALLHGCAGQAAFAIATVVCVLLAAGVRGRPWREVAKALSPRGKGWMASLTAGLAGLAYLQIVLGAMLRHVLPTASVTSFSHAALGHVAIGTLLAGGTVAVGLNRAASAGTGAERRLGGAAVGLIALQFLLGLATWTVKYALPWEDVDATWLTGEVIVNESFAQTTIVTLHVATGALVLATLTGLAVRTTLAAGLPSGTTSGPGADEAAKVDLRLGSKADAASPPPAARRGVGPGFAPGTACPMMGASPGGTTRHRWA